MNLFYFIMLVSSIVAVVFVAPESVYSIMLSGGKNAIELALTLVAIYAIWLSVLEIMEKIGLNHLLFRLFYPLTRKLFGGESKESQELISLNFSANLLGMGGAATPLGIKAMEKMQDGSPFATDNMILFMVINCTSIQLLPATIIGLRAAQGSVSASDIILPSLIATTISTIVGVILAKCFALAKKVKKVETTQNVNAAKNYKKINKVESVNGVETTNKPKIENKIERGNSVEKISKVEGVNKAEAVKK
ncbi:MAG: nucleoside recognition protein [Clostridia bacterium]